MLLLVRNLLLLEIGIRRISYGLYEASEEQHFIIENVLKLRV